MACGASPSESVLPLARQFSGAWPYQEVIAELAGLDDPLDEQVVRAYWTGNELTANIDRDAFGQALLARIKPRAGKYWSHLNDQLLVEAAPTHGFHVLGVYPWSRLLAAGQPEPLHVLDSCRISWATVVAVEDGELQVTARRLSYDNGALSLADELPQRISWRQGVDSFTGDISAGDIVAVHWGHACDRLSPQEAAVLEEWTRWQLDVMAPRLHSDR